MEFRFFLVGTSYHPERYPEDAATLAADAELMEQLHFNSALIAAEAVHYAMRAARGREWLDGVIGALCERGIRTAIEVTEPLPSRDFLVRLDKDERVMFFMARGGAVKSMEAEKSGGKAGGAGAATEADAAEIAARLKANGVKKDVALRVSTETLLSGGRGNVAGADILCLENNPEWMKGTAMENGRRAAFLEDRVRMLGKAPFFMTDINPAASTGRETTKLKRPGALALEVFQAASHGARGFFFREWRQPRTGASRYEGACIDHSERTDTRVFREIEQIGRLSGELTELVPTTIRAKAAVVLASREAYDSVYRLYTALRSFGISVDILSGNVKEFGRYALVFAPQLHRVSEETAAGIRSFVEGGGTFFANRGLATEDEDGVCYLGDAPHALTDVFGVRVLEADGLYSYEEIPLQVSADFRGHYFAKNACEILELCGAEAVMRYEDDVYKGVPALARQKFEKGFAYYLGTDLDDALCYDLCDKILAGMKGQAQIRMAAGISVQRLAGKEAEYIVFQNFTDKERRLPLDYNKLDILFGYDPMPVYGAMVLRVPRRKNRKKQE